MIFGRILWKKRCRGYFVGENVDLQVWLNDSQLDIEGSDLVR